MKKNLLIILSGPAGSGKTTLCNALLSEDKNCQRVITATTRQPREGEVDGVDYIFLSEKEFCDKLAKGEFYEYAKVHSRYYGTLKSTVIEAFKEGKDLFLIIDVQGAATWRKIAENDSIIKDSLLSIFIMPKSLDELIQRLIARNTDDKEEIKRRMQTAKEELKYAKDFDVILNSGTKQEDLESIKQILKKARLQS